MNTNRQTTNFLACALLVALALVPMSLPSTQSAYGDNETSLANLFQASNDFTPRTTESLVDVAAFSLTLEPQVEETGEVAGAKTEEAPTPEGVGGPTDNVGLEISEEPVKVTEPEPVVVETGGEPMKVVSPTEEPADEPTKPEVTEEAPEPQKEAPAPVATE